MAGRPPNAGVIAPPPLMLLAALMAGGALDWFMPLVVLDAVPAVLRWVAGGALIIATFALVSQAFGGFARAATPVQTRKSSTALVTDGVYAHVRNPIYLGFLTLTFGIALLTAGEWLALAGAALWLGLHFGVVRREERYLETVFGEDYRAYKARVPRYGWRF